MSAQKSGSAERSGQVQSLVRALRLLSVVAKADDGLTLTETANRAKLPVSSAHRLLSTLQQERFVRFDQERTRWFVGVEAFVAGSGFLRSRDMVSVARPYMRHLMEESGETVSLAVEEGGQAIYLAQVECRQLMRALASPGQRVPLHSSAVGKALIAFAGAPRKQALLDLLRLERFTERTIVTEKGFVAAVAEARKRRFAVDDEEHAIGLRCVAAPIFNEAREAVAAISLSGPKARVTDTRLQTLAGLAQAAAAKITKEYGGSEPA
ncbi:MAG: IclR family transcriptional regulator domain-containing protein [Alphaproteobacteria bacterium]